MPIIADAFRQPEAALDPLGLPVDLDQQVNSAYIIFQQDKLLLEDEANPPT